MVKKSQSRGLVLAIIATTILLSSTTGLESFTGAGILQQKCIACVGKMISDLKVLNGTLNNLAKEGAITAPQVENLSHQLVYKRGDLTNYCNCDCKYFTLFENIIYSFNRFVSRTDLLEAFRTVYWHKQCQKNLAGLTTGLKKLTYMDDAKRIESIAQDIEQCKKVVLNPDLKRALARNRYRIKWAIKKLNEFKE